MTALKKNKYTHWFIFEFTDVLKFLLFLLFFPVKVSLAKNSNHGRFTAAILPGLNTPLTEVNKTNIGQLEINLGA